MLSPATIKQILRPLISPGHYDFWARELGSVAAWERCFARVVSRSDESQDSFTLHLRPNSNRPAYQSGQHINLSAVVQGRRISRSYSLTSLPGERDLSITLRREPMGQMSNWLYDNAMPGAIVEIGSAFGDMTFAKAGVTTDDNLLFLAAGSGITPLYGLIRAALAGGHRGTIKLLYWDKTCDHFCFGNELRELEQHPQFSVQRIATRSGLENQNTNSGRISEAQIQVLAAELLPSSPHIFACGGADFVAKARKVADGLGQSRLYAESFTANNPVTDDSAETFYQIELARSRTSLEVSSKTNLLDALEAAGIGVESGCRMGICNTCSCPTRQGSTLDTSTGLLNNGHSTRLCISQARSNLILDL
ncbi:MAG: hypothetical protein CMN85_19770 [Spongiibacteraceae bacterium]|nr:hypothetical protein [Spongiibacteraceae bacterium]MBN51780.1 hypothetical protein [Spongiibacteraceae bacterium]|tara:strand:+ start:3782 stop:4873 length:1092 start_codon:yes stop_codon:yes gene_type:complete